MNDLDRDDPWEKRLVGRVLEIRTRCWTCYGHFWHVPGVRRCAECFEAMTLAHGVAEAARRARLARRPPKA